MLYKEDLLIQIHQTCEMCGAEGPTVLVEIDGVKLNVCSNCSRFGQKVKKGYKKLGLKVNYVDASKLFLRKLSKVVDPEKKRKAIGHAFVEVFQKEADKIKRR